MEVITILVVEDEPKVASLLKQGLVEHGYKVQLAEDGQEAISLILKNSYDVAILDVNVPYINGIELCKVLKNNRPEIFF